LTKKPDEKDTKLSNYLNKYENTVNTTPTPPPPPPLATTITNNKESTSLSSYYNKLYSTDLRPEPYNYDDYLYKPSSYYENSSSSKSLNYTNNNIINKDNLIEATTTDNIISQISSELNSTKSYSPTTPEQIKSPVQPQPQQQPYHVTSIPVVYVNSTNTEKVLISPKNVSLKEIFSIKPIYTSPVKSIDIEDIKKEIIKETEELSEANFHDAVKQQLDEELRMENDRKLLHKDDTPDNDNDDEEEDDDEDEESTESTSIKTSTSVEESTSEEIVYEETTSNEETTTSDETTGDETEPSSSGIGTDSLSITKDTTLDSSNTSSPIESVNTCSSLDRPVNPTSTAAASSSIAVTPDINYNYDDIINEEQESELVNMIKDIKSTLESCCMSEHQNNKKENPFPEIINDDNINKKVINQPNFKILNVINNIGKNSAIDKNKNSNNNNNNNKSNSNEEDSLLNTSQDEYEENEYFEIVY